MAAQTATEQNALKKKTFHQAASKHGWSTSDNGLFAEDHPQWMKASALQQALRAATKPNNNWGFGTSTSPPSTTYGQ